MSYISKRLQQTLMNQLLNNFKQKTQNPTGRDTMGNYTNTHKNHQGAIAILGILLIAFTYDANGNVLTIDGPRTDVSDVTTFTYDAMGNRATMSVDPDGAGPAPAQVTQFTSYDNSGRILSMTDPNGIVTDMTYDARGRLLTRTVAAGTGSAATTTFEYDGVGNVTKIVLPSNNELNYTYDAAQRLTRITDRQGHYIQYTLDNLGNRTKEEVFQNNGTLRRTQTRVFDQLSRMIQSIGGENQLSVFGYDGNGNQISVLDPLNRNSTSEYDGLQRLIKQTDPDTNDTQYAYDARDNLTSVTDPRGLTTTYTYNGLDDLTQLTSPDTGTTTYTYDDAGNRTSQTDARNITTNYKYDALNRLIQIEYPGQAGLNIDFIYDTICVHCKGRLREIQDNTGRYVYAYSRLGEVTLARRVSQGQIYDTRYTYDKAGNNTKITYPSGKEIQYVYNSIKRVKEVKLIDGATTTTLANNIVYRMFGPMQKVEFGNGLITTSNYDMDYRQLNSRTLPLIDYRYIYDEANNITSWRNIANTSENQDFIYDNLDRLTSADGNYGLINYTYDAVGNRLTKTDNGNTDTYAYKPTRHHLDDITDANSVVTDYNHTAAGSINRIGTDTYGYSKTGRMANAIIGGIKTTYRYDGKGQRTLKTEDATGNKTLYHYDEAGQLIAETQADGTTIREYIYLNGQPIAMLENNNLYYYHLDHLGTPQMMTDATQTVVWQANYDPFGNATVAVNTVTNNIRFPSQYFDSETGLHYNILRDYDPGTGRYMQSDSIGLTGGLNTYLYALANSTRYIDLDGAMPCERGDYPCLNSMGGFFNPKAFPQRGHRGIFPGGGPLEHHNRNVNQTCPPKNPCDTTNNNQCQESNCKDWVFEGRPGLHCSYKTYRGVSSSNQGFQCSYDETGNLVTDSRCAGTFDFSPPYDEFGKPTPNRVGKHFSKDVIPFLLFGN